MLPTNRRVMTLSDSRPFKRIDSILQTVERRQEGGGGRNRDKGTPNDGAKCRVDGVDLGVLVSRVMLQCIKIS